MFVAVLTHAVNPPKNKEQKCKTIKIYLKKGETISQSFLQGAHMVKTPWYNLSLGCLLSGSSAPSDGSVTDGQGIWRHHSTGAETQQRGASR